MSRCYDSPMISARALMRTTKSSGVVATCVLISLFGSALVLWGTRNGIGLWVDSASYIGAANNLLAQRGLTLPFAGGEQFSASAPLYALLLAGVGAAGFDVVQGARWTGAVFFGATMLVTGLAVFWYGRSKSVVPAITTLCVLLTPELIQLHEFALTEGLFLLTAMLGLILLARYGDTAKKFFLFASGAMIALACLTRYVGVVLIGTGIVGMLLDSRYPWRSRLKDSIVWSSACVMPLIVWALTASATEQGPSPRALGWNRIPLWKFGLAADVVRSWMLPEFIPSILFVVAVLAPVFLLATRSQFVRELMFPSKPAALAALPRLLALFNILYACLLIAIIAFIEPATATNARILAPAHLATILFAGCAWQRVEELSGHSRLHTFSRVCAVWILLLCAVRFPDAFSRNRLVVSVDFTAKQWTASPVMEQVKQLPKTVRIYTNAPEAVYLIAGRGSTALPKKWIPRMNRPNGRFQEEMAAMKNTVNQDAVFVYFNEMHRGFLPTKKELVDYFSLRTMVEVPDGFILKCPPAGG